MNNFNSRISVIHLCTIAQFGDSLQKLKIKEIYLLDFWSMGCYPCIMSIPELRMLSAKYQNELNIVGINLDTKKKFWAEASKRASITWVNFSDGKGLFGGASYVYGVNGFPTYILINHEGFIAERWMGFEPGIFNEKLSKYLQKQ